VVEDERHLTPRQERAIYRVHLGGGFVLVAAIIGARIAERSLDFAAWKLLGGFFVSIGIVLVVCTVIVASIERSTTREVATRTMREFRTDLGARLARIRHR
jgi:hypothetical protein